MARGSWFVVRGSWLVARPKGRPACGNPVGNPLFAAGSPRGSPYDCGPWDRGDLRTAACVIHRIQAGRLLGVPYDCGPWDRGDLRTADCVIHRIQAGRPLGVPYDAVHGTAADCELRSAFSQDSGGTPFGRSLRCGPWDRDGLRTATCVITGFRRDARYGCPFWQPSCAFRWSAPYGPERL